MGISQPLGVSQLIAGMGGSGGYGDPDQDVYSNGTYGLASSVVNLDP